MCYTGKCVWEDRNGECTWPSKEYPDKPYPCAADHELWDLRQHIEELEAGIRKAIVRCGYGGNPALVAEDLEQVLGGDDERT